MIYDRSQVDSEVCPLNEQPRPSPLQLGLANSGHCMERWVEEGKHCEGLDKKYGLNSDTVWLSTKWNGTKRLKPKLNRSRREG